MEKQAISIALHSHPSTQPFRSMCSVHQQLENHIIVVASYRMISTQTNFLLHQKQLFDIAMEYGMLL